MKCSPVTREPILRISPQSTVLYSHFIFITSTFLSELATVKTMGGMVAGAILLQHLRLSSNDTRRRRDKIRLVLRRPDRELGASLSNPPFLTVGLPNLQFDLRQAEQNDVADNLQATWADFIERVLL